MKNKNKTIHKSAWLMILIIGWMLITGGVFVNALESLGTFKQGDNISIKQVCYDSSYITIQISYPNSTIAKSSVNMTSLGNGQFNYFFVDTDTLGRYDITGISDGCDKTFATYFEITPSGFIGTLGFYIIILILSLGLIILGYAVEDAWVVILGGMGFILFGLFVYLYGINGMKDTAYTYGFAIITIMLGAYFAIRAALQKMDEGIDN